MEELTKAPGDIEKTKRLGSNTEPFGLFNYFSLFISWAYLCDLLRRAL